MADLLTKPIVAKGQWVKFYDFLGMVDASAQSGGPFSSSCVGTSGTEDAKIAGCVAALSALASWEPCSTIPRIARVVGLAAVSAFTAHLILGRNSNSHPTQDLTRAGSKVTIGPSTATTAAEAPLKGGVETRKMSGIDEPASQGHLKDIRLAPLGVAARSNSEAMALSRPSGSSFEPFGPPFDFWPICEARFNEVPTVGKDKWTALQNGWWVKEHREWRVRTFNPAHRGVPFNTVEAEPDRYTIAFWRGSNGGWLQQAHHDSWLEAPRNLLPEDPRTGRSQQWMGFSFFKMKEQPRTGAAGSSSREGPGGPHAEEGGRAGHRDREGTGRIVERANQGGSSQELVPPSRIGRGGGPIARARAAGPIVLRGSIARCFPGGVLPSQSEGALRLRSGQQDGAAVQRGDPSGGALQGILRPTSGAYQPSTPYHSGDLQEDPFPEDSRRRRHGAERAESESLESDPVTEYRDPGGSTSDPYEYALNHFVDAIEDIAFQNQEPLPDLGEEFPRADEIPPPNGIHVRAPTFLDPLQGAYYRSGLHVPRSPDQFSDEMSAPGEAIERLLEEVPSSARGGVVGASDDLRGLHEPAGPLPREGRRVPAGHPEWRPPHGGGADIEIRSQASLTESDGGFEMVDQWAVVFFLWGQKGLSFCSCSHGNKGECEWDTLQILMTQIKKCTKLACNLWKISMAPALGSDIAHTVHRRGSRKTGRRAFVAAQLHYTAVSI